MEGGRAKEGWEKEKQGEKKTVKSSFL